MFLTKHEIVFLKDSRSSFVNCCGVMEKKSYFRSKMYLLYKMYNCQGMCLLRELLWGLRLIAMVMIFQSVKTEVCNSYVTLWKRYSRALLVGWPLQSMSTVALCREITVKKDFHSHVEIFFLCCEILCRNVGTAPTKLVSAL